jgi:hypothetical protein
VDTARLRVLRTYPQVQALLTSLLSNQRLISEDDHQLLQLDKLPSSLKAAVTRAERRGKAWVAWRKGPDCSGITAELDEATSRMHSRPVLQVFLHDVHGRVIGSSLWLETHPNHWARCES